MCGARASFFFSLISVRCAVLKDPPKKVTYVQCYLNAKMEGMPTKPCLPSGLARRLPVKEFLSSKPGGAKFLKKTKCEVKS